MSRSSRFFCALALPGILICFLCSSCSLKALEFDESATASSIPTSTPLPTPMVQEPLPEYLIDVIPSPGSSWNAGDYSVGLHGKGSDFETETTTQRICVELFVVPLLLPGDDLLDEDEIIERISLTVNGLVQPGPDQPLSAYLERYSVLDKDGNVVAVGGGPYFVCWHNPLEAGVHTARFAFRKTSGRNMEYEWTFLLLDDR